MSDGKKHGVVLAAGILLSIPIAQLAIHDVVPVAVVLLLILVVGVGLGLVLAWWEDPFRRPPYRQRVRIWSVTGYRGHWTWEVRGQRLIEPVDGVPAAAETPLLAHGMARYRWLARLISRVVWAVRT